MTRHPRSGRPDSLPEVPATAVLVLSQYVEVAYADELLADGAGGLGHLRS
jgi:hypothetical protein